MLIAAALTAATAGSLPSVATAAGPGGLRDDGPQAHCRSQRPIDVPGAQRQEVACLADLTTAGTVASGHTVATDYAGLTSARTAAPARKVPGIQVDGYFPDNSTTNTHHGWNHDAQFVIRLPDRWNGKLVITGAPGVRRQYALDKAISDDVLARGYAFAATDKGNTGITFYEDGAAPGDALVEWNSRVTELTRAAQRTVRQTYGEGARRTYVTGMSNGGYLTRWQLENRPELYDGGVDWEGTLFRARGPNLLTYLPTALREYPRYKSGSPEERREAHDRMIAAGFSPGSEFLWDVHHSIYWVLTQRIYREEFDPGYQGVEADYDYASRPRAVKQAVRKVELTGRIARPMLTLHGTYDALLPRETDSDVYRRLIERAGRAKLHRYYVIEDGNHVDGFYDLFPAQLRPILPCFRDALTELEAWVERDRRSAPSGLIHRPADDVDPVDECSLHRTRR